MTGYISWYAVKSGHFCHIWYIQTDIWWLNCSFFEAWHEISWLVLPWLNELIYSVNLIPSCELWMSFLIFHSNSLYFSGHLSMCDYSIFMPENEWFSFVLCKLYSRGFVLQPVSWILNVVSSFVHRIFKQNQTN